MKEKKKILSKYKRSVTANGEEWTWQIQGKFNNGLALLLCNPKRTKKYKIMISQSISDDYDCDSCGVCNDCLGIPTSSPVTPAKVKALIEKHSSTEFKNVKDYTQL